MTFEVFYLSAYRVKGSPGINSTLTYFGKKYYVYGDLRNDFDFNSRRRTITSKFFLKYPVDNTEFQVRNFLSGVLETDLDYQKLVFNFQHQIPEQLFDMPRTDLWLTGTVFKQRIGERMVKVWDNIALIYRNPT